MKGGGEAAAQNRGRDEIHRIRKPDEVKVGRADRDLLSEGASVGEPRLGLMRADLSLPRLTPVTLPTPVHERHCDPISHRER